MPHTFQVADNTVPTICEQHELQNRDLKLVSINTQSINSRNNARKFELAIRAEDADIVAVQETSYNPTIPCPYGINGYTCVAKEDKTCASEKNPGFKGGVAIFVKNHYVHLCKVLPLHNNFRNIQICGIKFDNMNIVNVYRSPKTDAVNPPESERFAEFILDKFPPFSLVVVGDFNLNETNFLDRYPRKPGQRAICRAFEELKMVQQVSAPTRGKAILDLCFTYDNSKLKSVNVGYHWFKITNKGSKEPLYDHYPVIVEFATRPDYKKFEFVKDYRNTDITKFQRLVYERKIGMGREHSIEHFYVVDGGLLSLCKCGVKYCPLIGRCKCGKYHDPKIEIDERNEELAVAVTECWEMATPMKKKFFYSKFNNKVSPATVKQFNRIRTLERSGQTEKLLEEQLFLEELKMEDFKREADSLMAFWNQDRNNVYVSMKYARKNVPKTDGLYKDYDNKDFEVVYDEKLRADVLIKHSQKVLEDTDVMKMDWYNHEDIFDQAPFPARMREPVINVDQVSFYLSERCKKKMARGIDGVMMIQLQHCEEIIIVPLTRLYQLSYCFKYLPKPWCTAKLVFIPKKDDDLMNPSNLRGLNVCSALYFPLEYLQCDHYYINMEILRLISEFQFGMRSGYSAEIQLIHYHDFITEYQNRTTAPYHAEIFTDMLKAYDKVSHEKLMMEMRKHRFNIGAGQFFQSWLREGFQYVQVGQERSYEVPVRSSIKQGSVFAGKIGFQLIINGLFEFMTKKAKEVGMEKHFLLVAYCDDCKLVFLGNKEISVDENFRRWQYLLDEFQGWLDRQDLFLNPKKCVCLQNGLGLTPFKPYLKDHLVKTVANERDLGILKYANGSVEGHAEKVCNAAQRVIQSIKHIIPNVDYSRQLMMWNTLIRSVCLFGSYTTFPCTDKARKHYRAVFRSYWKYCHAKPPDQKPPVTILQFMCWKDCLWHWEAKRKVYPFALKPSNELEFEMRKERPNRKKEKELIPTNGCKEFSAAINKLKKVRLNSFRYRSALWIQNMKLEAFQTPRVEKFKKYFFEEYIQTWDVKENELVQDACSGDIRRRYIKNLEIRRKFRQMKQSELISSESEDDIFD